MDIESCMHIFLCLTLECVFICLPRLLFTLISYVKRILKCAVVLLWYCKFLVQNIQSKMKPSVWPHAVTELHICCKVDTLCRILSWIQSAKVDALLDLVYIWIFIAQHMVVRPHRTTCLCLVIPYHLVSNQQSIHLLSELQWRSWNQQLILGGAFIVGDSRRGCTGDPSDCRTHHLLLWWNNVLRARWCW